MIFFLLFFFYHLKPKKKKNYTSLLETTAVSLEVGAVTSASSHPVVPFSRLKPLEGVAVDELSGTIRTKVQQSIQNSSP